MKKISVKNLDIKKHINIRKRDIKKMKISDNFLVFLFAIALVALGRYRIGELTMPIILDDEFGYWSNSMLMTGGDWTSITKGINYYSYGYSIILCIVKKAAGFMGYGWADLYKTAVMFNVAFVAGGYLLSVSIARRYMKHMNKIMIPAVCFIAATYPSNMLYTHVTLTECALGFFFWLFAWTLMRAIDNPGIANHAVLALLAICLFAIHQRTIGLIITALIIVLILKLLRISRLRHALSFLGSIYVFYIIHSMMKAYVKNVNYLGNAPQSLNEIMSGVFTKSMFALFAALAAIALWLFILDKGRLKLGLALLAIAAAAVAIAALKGMDIAAAPDSDREARLAINELSGQIGVLKNIFTKYGLIRIGTSIVGKWYYLAASTGLVICWGMKDLLLNALFMLEDGCRRAIDAVRGKAHSIRAGAREDFREHIFLLGMFLSFASAFMICALYKEGLYKVDDLINGRYIEYLIGFSLIYSIDRLIASKHWLVFWCVFLAAYIAAGAYCQYIFDKLQRTEYELIHATAFGRVFWNYESPTGKVKEVAKYVLPLAAGFVAIFRAFASKTGRGTLAAARLFAALLLPLAAWNHIYTEIVDNYVVVRNEKQSGAAPQISEWVRRLSEGGDVYFITDGLSYRQAEILQYMCGDIRLVLSGFDSADFGRDALFILNADYLENDIIKERCDVVDTAGSYALAVNNSGAAMERWQWYAERMKPQPIEYIEYIDETLP